MSPVWVYPWVYRFEARRPPWAEHAVRGSGGVSIAQELDKLEVTGSSQKRPKNEPRKSRHFLWAKTNHET